MRVLGEGAFVDADPSVVALAGGAERRLVVRLRRHDAAGDTAGDVALDAPRDAVGVLAGRGIARGEVGHRCIGIGVVDRQGEYGVAQGEETGAAGCDDIGPVGARDAHAQGASRQPAVRRRLQLDIDLALGTDEQRAAGDQGRCAIRADVAEPDGEDRVRAGRGDLRAQVCMTGDLDRLGHGEVPGHRLGIVHSLVARLAVGQVTRAGDPCVDADVGTHGVGREVLERDRAGR